jgi:hypothetical protein
LTFALAAIGLYKQRSRVFVQVIALAILTTAILTTHLTIQLGLWPYVREIIPGAKALRALGRVGMIQLIPAAIGLGFLFHSLAVNRRWLILLLLGGLCVLEQVNVDSSYVSKPGLREDIAYVSAKVDPKYEAFFLFSNQELGAIPELASWTTLATGKPTINGRYGNFPRRYPRLLRRSDKCPGSVDRAQVIASLEDWCNLHGLKYQQIQLVEIAERESSSDLGP